MNTATPPTEGRRLIAPLWHTVLLIAFLFAIAAYGAYAQHSAKPGPELVERRGSTVPLYLSLLAAEWGLLRFVVAGGLRKTGTTLRDLLGQRWSGWKDVARDVAIALATWTVWTVSTSFIQHALGQDTAKDIGAMLPRSPLEIAAWVALSLTAGFCEEAIFRGYLQKQFQAITGSAVVAVLLQAVIFGVSHGYQGLRNVVAITILGVVYGAIALWRRSLEPTMILHAGTDIVSGIFGI
ncbi:MAG TPA: CPBP family intramembrane glutamic endopeptidase [Candidatus Binatia bacterium]|nr:CPBP family intramembrane glutamic endopeptidase [Candidatus Binatia bacterium]